MAGKPEETMVATGEIPDSVAKLRAELFCETPREALLRIVLGTLRAAKPSALPAVPRLVRYWLASLVGRGGGLPDPASAPTDGHGFCGIARDLSVPTLLRAYRIGLHPASHAGPAKWWSPPEHCILDFNNFHISRRLRARLRQGRYRITFDRDFEGTIKACAEPRRKRWPVTWITPKCMWAYAALHDAGYAHSFETWNEAGELVGGGYGVAVGRVFVIESQFARETHASKIAFCMLNWHLAHWGFAMNNNKGPAPNVLEMGFHTVPRSEYLLRLAAAADEPDRIGRWQEETDLATVAAWQPGESKVDAA
jgi:leucyl/phenylalanyl-tRNA---protein transferase